MEQLMKSAVRSHQHLIQDQPENSEIAQDPPKECTPKWFKQIYERRVGNIFQLQSLKYGLLSKYKEQIHYSQTYTKQFVIQVIDCKQESILVEASFGNISKKISCLITQIQLETNLMELAKGQYGEIYYYKENQQQYIFKTVDVVIKDGKVDLNKIYREFFMAFLASCLQVGPKLVPFFKYDIVIINNKAWFSMEKCSKLASSMKTIEADLTANLKTLHSLGFMHMDIKPDNVAFSPHFNKVVFLDFGFSQLIQEPLGFKTLTKYSGTLAYCSEEMRALYYLEGRKYVDLYYNDLVGLQRTLKEILGYNKISLIIAEKINAQEQNSRAKMVKNNKTDDQMNFISLISIIKLKYFIFVQEQGQIVKIVHKNPQLCSTLHNILSSQQIASKNFLIKGLVSKMKGKIMESLFEPTNIDQYFMKILKSSRTENFFPYLLSVYHILKLPKIKFSYFASNNLELQKLFFLLNPMSGYFPKQKSKEMLREICNIRLKIIEKIYGHLGLEQQETLLYEKVSAVTHYFYRKLGPMNKREILSALRMMFILLLDPIFVQIDVQLIKTVQDHRSKFLYGMEFQLFENMIKIPIKQKNKELEKICLQLLNLNCEQTSYYEKNWSASGSLAHLIDQQNKLLSGGQIQKSAHIWFIKAFASQLSHTQPHSFSQILHSNPQVQFMEKVYSSDGDISGCNLIENFIIQLTEKCLQCQNYEIFQYFHQFLKFSIIAYNRLSRYQRSFQIIWTFIQKIKFNRPYFNLGSQWVCIRETAKYFCRTAYIYFVQSKFQQIRSISQSVISTEEAFFELFLFYRTYAFIGMKADFVMKQVLRMFQIFVSPHPYVKQILRLLYKILRKSQLVRSKRKQIIYLRRQGNSKTLSTLLTRLMEKKTKQNGKQMKRLREKLRKVLAISNQLHNFSFIDIC